jgi:hypothetical protein
MIIIRIDYNNLKYFIIKKRLNKKQTRWAKKLVKFDFKIKYYLEVINFTNSLSRRLDYIYKENNLNNKEIYLLTLYNKLKLAWIRIS